MSAQGKVFIARHAMGRRVSGEALVAHDGFSARYDLDRLAGVFSRPAHKLAGQSYVGRILVLDTAKGSYTRVPLGRIARSVFAAKFGGIGDDLEYYVKVTTAGGQPLYFPAAAPKINQTLVALEAEP